MAMKKRYFNQNNKIRSYTRKEEGTTYVDAEGYIIIKDSLHPLTTSVWVREHIIIAQQALGADLPLKAVVHHVDLNRRNNIKSNLVICQDSAYHTLLHQRIRAFTACGNPNWRICSYCKQYDDIINLYTKTKHSFHRHCHAAYARNLRKENSIKINTYQREYYQKNRAKKLNKIVNVVPRNKQKKD